MAMKRYKSVDEYIAAAAKWQEGLSRLRKILLSTDLEETVKWGAPCYVHAGKNVVGIAGFKEYFGLWFHQGALLKDAEGVLINAQDGKTKALRQWRFKSTKEIKTRLIKNYVVEAIALAEAGKEIKPTRGKKVVVPAMLAAALRSKKKAQAGFDALTPGKQREYCNYIDEAKREETKQKRVVKVLPMIAAQQGLNDKYRDC